jgi:hypothetical protein
LRGALYRKVAEREIYEEALWEKLEMIKEEEKSLKNGK